MNMKKSINRNIDDKGQTILETALMIILLLMLIFGIAEISRAWWLKNQINNAARTGVRVAVVTSNATITGSTANGSCPYSTANTIRAAACGSITSGGLTGVNVITDDGTGLPGSNAASAAPGSPVRVTVRGLFTSVLPGFSGVLAGPGWSGTASLYPGWTTLSSSSVMRHE